MQRPLVSQWCVSVTLKLASKLIFSCSFGQLLQIAAASLLKSTKRLLQIATVQTKLGKL